MKLIFRVLILALFPALLMASDLTRLDDAADYYSNIFDQLLAQLPENGVHRLNLVKPDSPLFGLFLNGHHEQNKEMDLLLLDVEICGLLNQAIVGNRLSGLELIYPFLPKLGKLAADSVFCGLEIQAVYVEDILIKNVKESISELIGMMRAGWQSQKREKEEKYVTLTQRKPETFLPHVGLDNNLYARLVEKLLQRIGLKPHVCDSTTSIKYYKYREIISLQYSEYLKIDVAHDEFEEFLAVSGFKCAKSAAPPGKENIQPCAAELPRKKHKSAAAAAVTATPRKTPRKPEPRLTFARSLLDLP